MSDETKTLESLLDEAKDEIRRQVMAERVEAAKAGDKSQRAMSPAALSAVMALLGDAVIVFEEFSLTLSPAERGRLLSIGIKNMGFLQTAYFQAQSNPALVPNYVPMAGFKESMEDLERKRAILTLLEQFVKTVSDSMLADGDSAFHDALEFYNGIKAAARQRVPGAEIVYNLLSPYFKHPKSGAAKDQPTEKQLERDLRGLMAGSKEGTLTVENQNPDRSGGHRHVVDEVHPAD